MSGPPVGVLCGTGTRGLPTYGRGHRSMKKVCLASHPLSLSLLSPHSFTVFNLNVFTL